MRRLYPTWLFVSLLSVSLLATGCKTGASQKSDESLTDDGPQVPGYFKEIPADTLYVYTGLEPFPGDLARSMLGDAEEGGSFTPAGMLRTLASQMRQSPPVLTAIADELEGNFNPEGLEKLGFKLDAQSAIYGVGGIPVLRLELGDPAAFKAMLNRIETESDTDVSMKEADGQSYRVYREGDLVFPLVIRDGAVVTSAVQKDAADIVMPYILGQKMPEKSLADAGNIRDVADSYGYERFGVGYVNLERAITVPFGATDPGPVLGKVMEATDVETQDLSETCKTEIKELAGNIPRVVFGIQELSESSLQLHGGLEIASTYSEELSSAVAPVPAKNTELFRNAALSLGIGLNVKKWIEITRSRTKKIAEDPWECEKLEQFNRQAKMAGSYNVPPAVEQLRGVSAVLEGLEFPERGYRPSNMEAMAVVRTENPQALMGRLQAVVPGLMKADVKDDGVPVALPQVGQMVPFVDSPHIAMTDELVAFSAGVGMQDEMGAILEKGGEPDASMAALAFGYNLGKIQKSLPGVAKNMLKQAFGESYAEAMHGSSGIEIQLTGRGIFLETRSRRAPAEKSGGTQQAGSASNGSSTSKKD